MDRCLDCVIESRHLQLYLAVSRIDRCVQPCLSPAGRDNFKSKELNETLMILWSKGLDGCKLRTDAVTVLPADYCSSPKHSI
jgi:hypothetical protein